MKAVEPVAPAPPQPPTASTEPRPSTPRPAPQEQPPGQHLSAAQIAEHPVIKRAVEIFAERKPREPRP